MISIANYFDSIKSVDVNSLPQTLQEGHQFFIEAESVYDQDESIKETIDIYIQKLNDYLVAKEREEQVKMNFLEPEKIDQFAIANFENLKEATKSHRAM